ncbi:hypothetical protein AGDE_15733 [Angomonas deanei]|uniref:Uncharacterized protein n=1 Tax=Angomonas deanei TaxID=59799 RepID=A0A7G2CTC0_9TRYP|nr:hypothetical protein AGDE_15733 [Angomonas deanei]CAD2222184.1 hypothetical protein, conserved [Angomonas deanei]|eukprot:EPY18577.1 hypothetical protein AGDE_15733 [Angomonas deanei]
MPSFISCPLLLFFSPQQYSSVRLVMSNQFRSSLVPEVKVSANVISKSDATKKSLYENPVKYGMIPSVDQLLKDDPRVATSGSKDTEFENIVLDNLHIFSFESSVDCPQTPDDFYRRESEGRTLTRSVRQEYVAQRESGDTLELSSLPPTEFSDYASLLLFIPHKKGAGVAEVGVLKHPVSVLRAERHGKQDIQTNISSAWADLHAQQSKVNVKDFAVKDDNPNDDVHETPIEVLDGEGGGKRDRENSEQGGSTRTKAIKGDPASKSKIRSMFAGTSHETTIERTPAVAPPKEDSTAATTAGSIIRVGEKPPAPVSLPSAPVADGSAAEPDEGADDIALPQLVSTTLGALRESAGNDRSKGTAMKELEKLILKKLPSSSIVAQWAKPQSARAKDAQMWLSKWRERLRKYLREEQLRLGITVCQDGEWVNY